MSIDIRFVAGSVIPEKLGGYVQIIFEGIYLPNTPTKIADVLRLVSAGRSRAQVMWYPGFRDLYCSEVQVQYDLRYDTKEILHFETI